MEKNHRKKNSNNTSSVGKFETSNIFLYKIPKVTSLPHQIHRLFFKQIHFSLSLDTGLKYVFLKEKKKQKPRIILILLFSKKTKEALLEI